MLNYCDQVYLFKVARKSKLTQVILNLKPLKNDKMLNEEENYVNLEKLLSELILYMAYNCRKN